MADSMVGERLRFLVRGSQGDPYTGSFATGADGEVSSACTCMAGRTGRFCKHRVALLDGDVSDLLSDNGQDVARLREQLAGTALERAHQEMVRIGGRDGYQALEQASREASLLRQKVRVCADIAGTGITAGMIGVVVETLTPAGRGASFTDLADTAYLVRFTKVSLKEWEETLPAAPPHKPVGAELWLRAEEIEPLGEG